MILGISGLAGSGKDTVADILVKHQQCVKVSFADPLKRICRDVFDFTDEPHKVHILTQACRVADVVAELHEAADEAPLTVKGSMGQQAISPFIAEARAQRALLAQLLSRLGLPDTDEESQAKAAKPNPPSPS